MTLRCKSTGMGSRWTSYIFFVAYLVVCSAYKIGIGIADITGPPADVAFMGYANPEQKGGGLHLRQFSRAFIIDDGSSRIVFVSADCGMMGTFLRKEVLKRLKAKTGDLYTVDNVMISGTHTHSTPGGFLMDFIFDLNTWGFVPETFEAYAAGITRSILRAHGRLTEGDVEFSMGEVKNANINRSPTAYLQNPAEERQRYPDNVDRTFSQLKFFRRDGLPLGVITWFAVHPTSMNNTNTLVSSDNVGLASVLFEQRFNKRYTKFVGKGPFVAAFASTNLGDVSPNIMGARCLPSGAACDADTSACADKNDKCIAVGPGRDMFDSTYIIASRIAEAAWETWRKKGRPLNGRLVSVHQYVHMPSQTAPYKDPTTGKITMVKGCLPAMGYSFAAGTTDGPGAFSFKQGTKTTNPLWNAVTDLLAVPSQEMIECQAPKPILLATGLMNFPLEWQPAVVSTQLAMIGDVAIACVPGEFTTMSGRRLRKAVAGKIRGGSPDKVIVAGLCNTYSDYITTPQEYQVQRYEGASTIYGPHTLTVYLNQYAKLAEQIMRNVKPEPGPEPPDSLDELVTLLPPVFWDMAGYNREFGGVLVQPRPEVRAGESVSAVFVSGHPRNNLQTESTYLLVERLEGNNWEPVATDANWETKFIWRRQSKILGTSNAEIVWDIPTDTRPGTYRIRHFGHYKHVISGIKPYEGISDPFEILP